MADVHSWVETAGVVIGLSLTAASFWRDADQRELSNILKFDDKHEALWKELYGREDLKRLHLTEIDLKTEPPSVAETQALIRAFISFQTGWKAATRADRSELEPLRLDMADFLSRPLPRAIWEQTKKFRIPKFVRFVKKAMDSNHSRESSRSSAN